MDAPILGSTIPDPVNGLPLNQLVTFTSGTGYYLLRSDGCSLLNQVRSTKEFMPQADGAILHCRFLAGMEMNLAIQMWQDSSNIACDQLLQEMVDTLEGYLYGLLNAGDNQGRIRWAPTGGSSNVPLTNGYRMLEDIRLLTYWTESQSPGNPLEISFTLDTVWPYVADETQDSINISNIPAVVTNYGNRPTYPVWKIFGPLGVLTLTNSTTGELFTYNTTLPAGGVDLNVLGGEYIEIDTFLNTVTKVSGAILTNVAAGISMTDSVFFTLPPGGSTIVLNDLIFGGATGQSLVNGAWS